MTSQLLFGEVCHIITKKHNNWYRISCHHDQYQGWVDGRQLILITEKEFKECQSRVSYALDIVQSVVSDDNHMPILLGSSLPRFDGISCRTPIGSYRYSGQVISQDRALLKPELLRKVALKYLHAPYLWGGRGPFGLDSSGLVQVLFKMFGISMPRDAYQQAMEGEILDFVNEGRLGDLAFFENEDGKICHVGLILESDSVLHAFGHVRIDLLDHYGIYNKDVKNYTHKLRFIKRIINFEL
jgi:cell wall-associated NlpC family hydrolase